MCAIFNDRNDILVEGKKISGNSVYSNGDCICQHGTVLVDTDLRRMEAFLTPDISKLNRNRVSSVLSRVENLRAFDPRLEISEIKKALIKVTDATAFEHQMNEKAIIKMEDFFRSHKWIFGGGQ